METKKNPKLDLDRKRGMFFNIGLAISVSLVLASFEWKTYGDLASLDLESEEMEFDPIIDVPVTAFPPPPPPKVELPVIKEVPNDEVIEDIDDIVIDIEFEEDAIFEDIIFEDPIPDEVAEEIIDFAEKMPEPMGGMTAFYKYVAKHVKYPSQARKMGIEGRVFVQFVVDQSGQLVDVKAIKGIGGGCDEEAERIIKSSPIWKPGKQRGQPVKVRMILPITFQLN